MTEREKLLYTKEFIDKLADGVNPLTDERIPEGDLLNNIRISRCMFYVSEILRKLVCGEPFEGIKVKATAAKKSRLPFRRKSDKTSSYRKNRFPRPNSADVCTRWPTMKICTS